jgi:hypothetical protein
MWEKIRSNRLTRDISAAMVVKLVLLVLLWWAFFSDPIDVRIGGNDVARMMFSPPSAAAHKGPVRD